MRDFSIDYCNFGDKRLDSRFLTIIAQLSSFVGSSIPYCGVAWSQTKAIYRFLSNIHVSFEQILRVEQERVQHYVANSSPKVLYHIQDTTTLNYSDQKGRYDLGCLNYIDHRGFFLHSSVILDDQKVMQGYLEADIYNRDPSTLGFSRNETALSTLAQSLPIEAKESYRWVRHFETFQALVSPIEGCHGISISDAESDFYELFLAKKTKNVDLIVRIRHNHLLVDSAYKLLDTLAKEPSKGYAWIETLTGKDKHNQRSAQLEIRYKKVILPLPERLKWSSCTPQSAKKLRDKVAQEGHLTLWAVQAKEVNAPIGVEPIEWTVLTTIPVGNYWEALDIIQTYALRWQIEVFHMALKEGCAVEKLQLLTQDRLKNAIALYCIIAVQVVKTKYLAENCPEMCMTLTGFSKQDYFTLASFLLVNYGVKLPQTENPTVKLFTNAIILLAGGNPKHNGIRQLWKGFAKADTIFKTAKAIRYE
jgi:hypothetical protein